MNTRRTYLLAAAATTLWLAACDADTVSPESARQERAARAVEIVPHTVAFRADRTRIEAVGTARARRAAVIFPETGGEVTEVAFEAGDRVRTGDTLVTLDDREERLALARARVAVRDAELQLERFTKLEAPSAIARSQVDDARIALENARIDQRLAEVALADRTVRAPFDGYVGLTDIDPGARITPATEITRLDDRAVLYVDFDAPEQVFGRIAVGDTIAMTPFSDPDRAVDAAVERVDSRIDTDTRTFTVRARVDNPADAFRPGMSFQVNFELPGRRYPAIPEAAIVWGGDGAYLWAVRDGTATRVPLTIISRQDGLVLVRAPLAEGSSIVAEGVQKVREGTAVTERYAGGVPPATAPGEATGG